MERKNVSIVAMLLIVAFVGGFGSSYLLPKEVQIQNENFGVEITSLKDNQEVHSVVVIDAAVWGADEVEVLVNGEKVANYLPYYWNNMLMPVGKYEIVVNIYENKVLTSSDNKTVIIPEIFNVPEDYEFTEDFVVHIGQTVNFNYDFNISENKIVNGWNDIDEKTYYSINVYGNLTINGDILCKNFLGEGNSQIYWETGSIQTLDVIDIVIDSGKSSRKIIRFDDNAILYFKTDRSYQDESYSTTPIISFYDGSSEMVFFESSTYIIED